MQHLHPIASSCRFVDPLRRQLRGALTVSWQTVARPLRAPLAPADRLAGGNFGKPAGGSRDTATLELPRLQSASSRRGWVDACRGGPRLGGALGRVDPRRLPFRPGMRHLDPLNPRRLRLSNRSVRTPDADTLLHNLREVHADAQLERQFYLPLQRLADQEIDREGILMELRPLLLAAFDLPACWGGWLHMALAQHPQPVVLVLGAKRMLARRYIAALTAPRRTGGAYERFVDAWLQGVPQAQLGVLANQLPDVDATDWRGTTLAHALAEVAERGEVSRGLAALAQAGADLSLPNRLGDSVAHLLMMDGVHVDDLRLWSVLLQANADLELPNRTGASALAYYRTAASTRVHTQRDLWCDVEARLAGVRPL